MAIPLASKLLQSSEDWTDWVDVEDNSFCFYLHGQYTGVVTLQGKPFWRDLFPREIIIKKYDGAVTGLSMVENSMVLKGRWQVRAGFDENEKVTGNVIAAIYAGEPTNGA